MSEQSRKRFRYMGLLTTESDIFEEVCDWNAEDFENYYIDRIIGGLIKVKMIEKMEDNIRAPSPISVNLDGLKLTDELKNKILNKLREEKFGVEYNEQTGEHMVNWYCG